MLEQEYFIIIRENNDHYPLFKMEQNALKFYTSEKLQISEPVKMTISDPVPKKYQLVDYHPCPLPVFSSKSLTAIQGQDYPGLQLFPVVLNHPTLSSAVNDFILLHAYNFQNNCINRELSIFNRKLSSKRIINGLEKIVLNQEVFSTLKPQEKKVIVMEEKSSLVLYHQELIEKIAATNPKGVRFIPVAEYSENLMFQ